MFRSINNFPSVMLPLIRAVHFIVIKLKMSEVSINKPIVDYGRSSPI